MNKRFFSALLLVCVGVFPAAAADVVIHEIMYHPPHTAAQAEDTGREWIELFNRGTNAVNLHQWRLTRGVEFTFSNVTLPAGGYLVVAASKTNFLAAYPSATNVVGDWTGRLSNSDDELSLLNSAGEEVDAVDYADSGEWAVRARQSLDAYGLRGWDWLAPHDGGGNTLELINPAMPNEYGQNWSASLGTGGTPGAANSVTANNSAPFIQRVVNFPLVPRSIDTVTITARIEDELTTGLSVTLFYRNASFTSPPGFSSLTMFDDGAHGDDLAGDGLFGATISAQVNNTVIEYYISATDSGARTRLWPAPAQNAPDLGGGILPPTSGANAVYQVDDSTYSGTQPYYRIVMTETERAFLASIAGNLRNSDAQANGTFVTVDPNGTEQHHRTGFRRRGAGSRGAAVPNYRVNFGADDRWKGVTAINLNSQYPHSQVAGSVIAALAGLQAEYQKPVQVRVNNVNLNGANSFAQQEVPDGDFADNHFPNDSNGNIYRGSTGNHSATLAYLGTDPNSYISAGYRKTSNGAEYDWSDLIDLTFILNNTPDVNYVAAVQGRVNVQQWLTYFATFSLLESRETSLGTGQGDDYGMYRGIFDPRFQLLGHDFDTVLGQGDTAGNVNSDIFRATAVAAINRFLRNQEFAPLYFRTLTNLMATAFAPPTISATLDQHLGSWVNAGVIANMKTFSSNRNVGVSAQIPLAISITHGLPVQNGYPRTTIGTTPLSGRANAIETRSVLVNGTPAIWTAWSASWTASVILRPGINRVLVQSFNASGQEFERAYLDIWRDTGTTTDVSGFINGTVTWTAANGPYQITGPLTVVEDAQLIIEPGTTVFVAPGAVLTVNETGFIKAEGTDTQRIRIGRNPLVAGQWGSLDIINAPSDNRFTYVDFDSCAGTTVGGHHAQIHVNNSRVLFSHCTWPATPAARYLSFNNSTFIVEHCTFPTYPAPVPASLGQPGLLHGVNGIRAGGYGIIRDNHFGHTWGTNDTIDFAGGQRPGAVLQIIGNIFDGASDDHLDLDSTDAWIEGNIFLHAHRDPNRTDNPLDTASAISGGVDTLGQNSDWTIINNLFYDVDHVLLNKGNSTTTGNAGGRIAFLYNTVSHVARENSGTPASQISVFNWSDNNVVLPDPALGSGLYAAHNIIHDAAVLQRFYNPANLNVIFENNLFPPSYQGTTNEWTGPGRGNRYLDPRLNLGVLAGVAVSNVTPAQVRQAFQLLPGSPAFGAGGPAPAAGARNIGSCGPLPNGGRAPAPGLAIGGEPTGTNTSTSAVLTVGPGGIFNWGTNAPQPWGWTAFRWKLDDGAWSAVIPVTNLPPFTNLPTITLSNLSNGPHTVFVVGRNDAGYFQDDPFVYPTNSLFASNVTVSRTWVVDTNLNRLILNEVLANNVEAEPAGGGFPDLIELRNAGSKPVSLADMSLTDDPLVPRKFVFPAGTTLAPGAFLVLIAGNGEAPGETFLGFSLNDSGEGVYLYDAPASGGALRDSVVFGLQLQDRSVGRLADGTWGLTVPTFGAENIAQPVGDPSRLRINEWLAASGNIFQEDFIELFNPDPLPVALGGLALSHKPQSLPLESPITPLSFIAGGGWRAFIADEDTAAGANHVNFKLSAEGGWISLARPDGVLIDMIVYQTQVPDVSQGRSPDGATYYVSFNQPTPGAGNPGETIIITPINTTIIPLTQTWRMEASSIDLGTAWRAINYDDSSWFSGAALFFGSTDGANPPIPANTTIPLATPRQTTVYFRSSFVFNGAPNGASFFLSHVLDDGCVLYLNNQEIYRYNFAPGVTVTYSSRPSLVSGTPQVITDIPVALPNLVVGTNYLAIEVHQQSSTSSDLAMALGIESRQFVTNFLNIPVLLSEVFTKNDSFTNATGKIVDWVELFNPSTNIVDLSELSLTDDLSRPRRWVFPQGATIAPNGYYVVEFDDSEPYSPFNAGFELSADSGAVYLFHRPSVGGALLDSLIYGVQVADLSLGRTVPGPNNTWALSTPTRGFGNVPVPLGSSTVLRINEWMPNPPSGEDDWFEIYNPGSLPVSFSGLFLTDDQSNPLKHQIRPLSFIGAGPEAWVKFIADENTLAGGDHVSFRLGNTESIGLYRFDGLLSTVDRINYTNAQSDVSYGRLPDGVTNFVAFPDSASPEEANWLPLANSVVISEALTRPTPPLEQLIELRNPSDTDVAIGGWYLSNARKDLKRFLIPPGTLLPAHGFKVFSETQFNPTGDDVPPSFALNSFKDDEIILSVADANGALTGYRARVSFGPAAAGMSFGRHEKSSGDDFVAQSTRTPGTTNAYPLVGPLVINEIHYHPPDYPGALDNTFDEFIEIHNPTAFPVLAYDPAHPTNTWRLTDAVDFDFPPGTILPEYNYVIIVGFDPTTNATELANFRAKHGMDESVVILGPWIGKLDNSSDSVELKRPDSPVVGGPDAGLVPYILVERVKYSDVAPWPFAADGNTNGVGFSLQRLVATDYGNDPVNWIAGMPTPGGETGFSGGQVPTISSAPGDLTVAAGSNVVFSVGAVGAVPLTYQWRLNGAVIPNATNSVLILLNAQATNAGLYSVLVANEWGLALGGPARLSVMAPPLISQHPQSRTVVAGDSTTFIVTASGGALQYQWRLGGTNLAGATSPVFSLQNIQTANAGNYSVVVSNSFGSTTSTVALLTVLVPPGITTQPQSLSVIIGSSAEFVAVVGGTVPLHYQWRLNGTNVAGANGPALSIGSAQPADAGAYTLVVTNAAGSVTSVVATLTVVVPPTVTVVASDANAAEPGANTGTFTFTRAGGTASNLTVNYVVSGTAGAGTDYSALSGTATFTSGQSSLNVIVTPLDDAVLEGDESVTVTVTSSVEYLIGGPGVATVVIRDEDNAPPVITLLTPTNGQLFLLTPTNVSFTVSASDADGSVAKVEYFAGAPSGGALTNKLGESTVAPFNFTWTNAPAGTNALVARVTDNLGSTAESEVAVVVLNARPGVSIVSPVAGASFSAPATFTINVIASDADGAVTQVVFYVNASLLGVDGTSPFSSVASGLAAGSYALRAVAVDNRGVVATSAVVNVVVNQPGVFDDFEPDIDLAQWSAFGDAAFTLANTNGGSVSPTRSLWFGGDNTRSATTRSVNSTLGGTILFQLRMANGGGEPWETADLPGEGVALEYSVNGGGAWVNIATFDTFGAPYTTGWAAQQVSIPGGAQTANTLFRWRQLSHSGACCDHWAIDDVQILIGPTPPTIATQPTAQSTVVGGTVTFSLNVFGSAPIFYQWRLNGTNLPGATGATLQLNNVTTNQAGVYAVLVTNAYGFVLSSNASLTVLEAGGDFFRIAALTANNSALVEHNGATGDDRGGIATSSGQVFVTGDNSTGRFAIGNLSGGTSVGTRYDGIVGDLRSETAYTFGTDAVTPAVNGSLVLTHLLALNPNTGALTGNAIPLSTPLFLNGFNGYGFFSGYGRVAVHDGARVQHIALPSGVVTDLGAVTIQQHSFSESWGYWGVAELDTNGVALVYVRDSQTIVRTRVPSGVTSNLATFSSLSDMASFTVSVSRGRWYFHHEGSSQFGGSDESVGYADAQFLLSPGNNVPPIIVLAPKATQAILGSNALFSVTALGSPTLAYQWQFNGTNLPGATTQNLPVLNVQADDVGTYTVVITNQFGAITSAPVTLAIQQPAVDHFEFSAVASPQTVNVPFSVTITARDASNVAISNFHGTVGLGGFVGGGTTSTSILSSPVHVNTSSGDFTLGYAFTPDTDITVTAVRHYFGTKVSIWTDEGVLLAAQTVTSAPGTWAETPLSAPLALTAGTTYRVAGYTGGGNYYWRDDGLQPFANGTIEQSFNGSGDGFPNNSDVVRWWFVDLRYIVGSYLPVAITPTNSGVFTNGAWTGDITVLQPAVEMFLAIPGQNGASAQFDALATNDLVVRISDRPDPVAVGSYLTNVITVYNVGPALATAITVTNFLPPSVSFGSASASQGGCVLVAGRVECALGSLTGGTTATVTVVTVPGAVGTLTNRVGIGRGEGDSYAANNTAESVSTAFLPTVDHFEFSTVASPQTVNVPFSVTITARDAMNVAISNFHGTVTLGGLVAGGTTSTSILSSPIHANTFPGDYTLGYSFTPSTDITITAVRHYFGTKVSIWTEAGVLLAAQPVTSVPGTWVETPLAGPLALNAGTTYRVAAYTGGGDYYFGNDFVSTFQHGTINSGVEASGDAFPFTPDGITWFVDLRYFVGSFLPVAITPTTSGVFTNGSWTGNITVLQPALDMFLAVNGESGTSGQFDALPANDLSVMISDRPDPVAVGGYLTNVITVFNFGPATATAITVTNFLPPSVSFSSFNASQGGCVLVGGRVECALGSVTGGATATVTVVTVPGVIGSITNRVGIGRAEGDPFATNNTAQSVTAVLMPTLSIADASVVEGSSGFVSLVFNVQLSPASPTNVSVNFATLNDTAESGTDYVGTNGVLTFTTGQTNRTITVLVRGDTTPEPTENFGLNLSGATNAIVGDAQAIGTILTDEIPPYVYLRSTFGSPWGSFANETAMNRTFGTNFWQDLRYESAIPAQLFTAATRFIFMEGSDSSADEMEAFLNANLTTVENWVAAGGRLFLNAAPNEGNGMSLGFGATLVYSDPTDTAMMTEPQHPIFLGPFTPVGSTWTGGSFGHATVTGTGLTTLITNAASGNIVLGQKQHGDGLVMFGGMTTDNFHSPQPEASNLRANILEYTARYTFCTNCPPTILGQPTGIHALVGSNATFSGTAVGTAPLSYQWFFNAVPLPGKTNSSLVVTNVRSASTGAYHFVVSNPFGAETSVVALLTVNYGASTSNTVPILGLTTAFWRYNQSAAYFNNAWAASNFVDTGWSGPGRALLAVESAASITPLIGTSLSLGRTSYYFRTWFHMPTNFPPGTLLRATTMIDDGAVIFINGQQVQRVRMTSGNYGPNTFANAQPPVNSDASQEFFYWFAATNLVRGSNVIAAEVHQINAGSSDIVWGMALDALVPVSNRPPTIVTHPISRVVSNGVNISFTVAATGSTPLTYQWKRFGTNLPGSTSTTLLITNVQRRHAGVYAVQVTNPYDTALSSNATLTVLVPPIQIVGGTSGFTAPGQFTLSFLGDAGGIFAVETSTNLVDWTQTGTVTNLTGTAQFHDPTAGESPQRYYRLRLLP
jgi:uncharacterized repeat protein (TIGR01451 family)